MRKVLAIVGVIVVLIVLAVLIVPHFIDVNQHRGQIEAELQKKLDRKVTLGDMHLSLLPPSVKVNGFTIAEDPAFATGTFAKAQQLNISLKLLPLLHKDVQVSSLELRQPTVELIKNQNGKWNFSTIGQPAAGQQPQKPQQQPQKPSQQQPQQQPQQSQSSNFALDYVKISDGTVAVTDRQKGQGRSVYDHLDLTLKNYAPGKPFYIDAAAHLPGKGSQTIRLTANAGPINETNSLATPFSGTLKLNEVDIAGIQKYLNLPQLQNMAGVMTGTTDVNNENGKLSSRGSLKINDARVNGVNIGYPISADYRFADDLAADLINVEKADIKLGSTPLSVSGTVNTQPTPSQIDLRLKASDVSIGEAAKLASAFGVAFSPGMNVAGRVNADVQAKGPANQPAMNGTVNARDLVVSGGDLPEQVKIQAMDLNLTPQQIRSNPFTAVAGSTNVAAQVTLTKYTTPSPVLDATLRTANAQVSELLAMARAYGVSAADGVSGSGTLNLDVHATGPIKNSNAMMFNGTGALRNATLKPPSFTQPLNIKNADLRFTSNSAVLSNLAAALGSTNATGNATVTGFAAPNVKFALTADKVIVAELQQITGGSPQSAAAQNQRSSLSLVPRAEAQAPRRTAAPQEPSILSRMTANGTLNAGVVQYDQLVLNNMKATVSMAKGIVTLSPITTQLYGGQGTGQITANLLTTPMHVSGIVKMNSVQANNLLSSTTSLKDTIYGLLAANTNLSFNATSSQDIARTLNGTAALDLSNGKIAKIDILNELAQIGKFVGVRKNAQAMTNVAKMSGNFNVTNGVAATNNLQAAIDGGSLAAAGTVNLASQAIDMHVTAVLDKNVAQQAGGTSIGGFMQTALANNRGELVMPVIVTGTFDHPQFAPDLQKIAQMKMNNLLPSVGNPGAVSGIVGAITKGGAQGGGQKGALGNILGALGGQQQNQGQPAQGQPAQGQPPAQQNPQGAQQQQQQQANPVGDLVNSIFGNKKKQQQQQQKPPR